MTKQTPYSTPVLHDYGPVHRLTRFHETFIEVSTSVCDPELYTWAIGSDGNAYRLGSDGAILHPGTGVEIVRCGNL